MTNAAIACIAIIVAAVSLLVAVILFAILHYHQMLLVNEINKRLALMTSEAIEKERMTLQEYQEYVNQMDERTAIKDNPKPEYEEGFNPHAYVPADDEESVD